VLAAAGPGNYLEHELGGAAGAYTPLTRLSYTPLTRQLLGARTRWGRRCLHASYTPLTRQLLGARTRGGRRCLHASYTPLLHASYTPTTWSTNSGWPQVLTRLLHASLTRLLHASYIPHAACVWAAHHYPWTPHPTAVTDSALYWKQDPKGAELMYMRVGGIEIPDADVVSLISRAVKIVDARRGTHALLAADMLY
jgi:hypothetical protein